MTEVPARESLQDLLVRRSLDQLAPEERARLEYELAANPALSEEAQGLERTIEWLAHAARTAPPARLRARVLASAGQQGDGPDAAARTAMVSPARRQILPLALAASVAVFATIVCAMLFADNVRLQRKLDLQHSAAAMLREPNIVLTFALQGSGATSGASGVALLDLDARRASIAVRSLPSLPSGQTYHLWALLADKSVFCGKFLPGSDGRILTQFAIPVDSYTSPIEKLILTVEAGDTPAAPQGSVAMAST